MALEELLAVLRSDAAERRAEIAAEAEKAARRIEAESAETLRRRKSDFLAGVEAEETDEARRVVSHARMEAMHAELSARGRFLARVREALDRRVASAADDDAFARTLPAVLRAGLVRLPSESVVVSVPAPMADALAEATKGVAGVEVRARDGVDAGFVAESSHGFELDGTLRTRLEQEWPRLAVRAIAGVEP